MNDRAKNSKADAHSEDNRRGILDAAIQEFAEHGLEGSRVDRIAGIAGVNKALLYYYFNSKENLFSAVIDEHFRKILPLIRKSFEDAPDPETALRQVAGVYSELTRNHPRFVRLLVRELARPDSPMVTQAAQKMRESEVPKLLIGLLKKGREDGSVRKVDLHQTVVSFISMNLGYFILAPIVDRVLEIDNRDAFIDGRAGATVDLFLRGILKR